MRAGPLAALAIAVSAAIPSAGGALVASGASLLQQRSLRERVADAAAFDDAAMANLHTVYPAGCSLFSLHQAVALDWSWRNVKQPGRLTRVVTGCRSESEKQQASRSVLSGDPRFDVFFTEDWNKEVPKMFSEVRNDSYMAYNRPFALAAWFERARPKEAFVMYLDADMIFIEPLLYHLPGPASCASCASEGRPVAQYYKYVTATTWQGMSDPGWHDFAVPELCGSGCRAVADAQMPNEGSYKVGSPIVMHQNDWAKLLPLWTNYTVYVRSHGHVVFGTWINKGDPPYIAEMIAYSLAAVMSNLPHQVVDFTMDGQRNSAPPDGARLIHLCFPFRLKKDGFRWNKYRAPFGWGASGFSQDGGPYLSGCGTPLFQEPPERAGEGRGEADTYWMIQQTTRAYNRAFLEFKQRACAPEGLEARKLIRVDEDGWFVVDNSSSWGGKRPALPEPNLIAEDLAVGRNLRQPA